MLSRALKMAFWVTYDHLGKLLLANLLWALAVLVPGMIAGAAFVSGDRGLVQFVGVPAGLIALLGVLPVGLAGLAHMVKVLIDERDGSVRDFAVGVRLYWARALVLGVLYALALLCLSVSVWFYAVKFHQTAPWVGYALSAVALWTLVFVLLSGVYLIPTLVQKKVGVRETAKLAALLVLDNPLFTLGLTVHVVLLISLSIVIPVFFLLISGACVMVLVTSAYEILARKYARLQQEQETQDEAPNHEGPSRSVKAVSRVRSTEESEDDQDDYLNRGFRDALFPWKG